MHQDGDIHEVEQFTHGALESLLRAVGWDTTAMHLALIFFRQVPSMARLFRNTRIGTLGALLESDKRCEPARDRFSAKTIKSQTVRARAECRSERHRC